MFLNILATTSGLRTKMIDGYGNLNYDVDKVGIKLLLAGFVTAESDNADRA